MSSPTCPACKAKFSHDKELLQCRKCGLPDEIRDQGMRAIARWKRKPVGAISEIHHVFQIGSKRQRKQARRDHPARRHRYKHGRIGVVRRPLRHKFSSPAIRNQALR